MAIQGESGSPSRGKKRFAYIRVGYKHGSAGMPVRKAVFKWVRVGSPFYKQLRSKGVKPRRISVGKPGSLGGAMANQIKSGNDNTTRGGRPEQKSNVPRPQGVKGDKKPGGGGDKKPGGGGPGPKPDKPGGGPGGPGPKKPKPVKMGSAKKLAKAMTNQQYAGLLNSLKRAQEKQIKEETSNLGQIGDWYEQVGKTHKQATAANVAASQGAQDDFGRAAAGIAAAFGGDANQASSGAGSFALNQRGLLEQLAQSQGSFDQDFASILATQGAEGKTREMRYQNQLAADLADQEFQARQDKGNAYVTNLASAQAQLQNMQLAQQEFGLKSDLGYGGLALQGQQMQADAADKKNQDSKKWKDLNPGQRGEISNRMRGLVLGERGGLRYSPLKALNMMGQELKSLGYGTKKNPQTRAWRDNLLRQYVTASSGMGGTAGTGWKIKGKKLVSPKGTVVYTFR